jgi:hypothetical protein
MFGGRVFQHPFFPLTRQQLKTENNKLNIYTQYLMKSTFETIWLFFHRPVGLVELLILYARAQFYTPRTSDYRLNSKTVISFNLQINSLNIHSKKKNVELNLMFISQANNIGNRSRYRETGISLFDTFRTPYLS